MKKGPAYPLLFLDTETTGHDPLRCVGGSLAMWHEIIEVGMVAVASDTLNVLGNFEIKITPKHPERCLPDLINHYPARAARGEWNNAVSLPVAISELFLFCSERNVGPFALIGQNFFFDWSFLSVALATCAVAEDEWSKFFHYAKLDTRSMAVQELAGPEGYDPKDYSLRGGLLQKRLCIPPEPLPHTALNGAYQAYHLYKALAQKKSA
ncbi:MAG TPA: 3'-5' exonuclease [Candidatus Paceibacterota bacterium]